MILYKLYFKTPLHLGIQGIGYEKTDETLHCDTIYSAVLSLWQYFYPDEDIDQMIKNPPFILSSSFPFYKDIYFFPKPIDAREPSKEPNINKKIKKIKYIDKQIFENILNNNHFNLLKGYLLQNNTLCATQKLSIDLLYKTDEVPRVTVDRLSNESTIFYFSQIYFNNDCGLYFLVDFKNNSYEKKFSSIMRLLGDEGIGGDRHMGKGQFQLKIEKNFSINLPEAENIIALSLYHSTKDEIRQGILDNSSYDFISRNGWLSSGDDKLGLKRQEIKMFTEGSIFKNLNKPDYGDIPVVLQKEKINLKHNVYRYGKGFMLPIKTEN